jgi:hypothetical protein
MLHRFSLMGQVAAVVEAVCVLLFCPLPHLFLWLLVPVALVARMFHPLMMARQEALHRLGLLVLAAVVRDTIMHLLMVEVVVELEQTQGITHRLSPLGGHTAWQAHRSVQVAHFEVTSIQDHRHQRSLTLELSLVGMDTVEDRGTTHSTNKLLEDTVVEVAQESSGQEHRHQYQQQQEHRESSS